MIKKICIHYDYLPKGIHHEIKTINKSRPIKLFSDCQQESTTTNNVDCCIQLLLGNQQFLDPETPFDYCVGKGVVRGLNVFGQLDARFTSASSVSTWEVSLFYFILRSDGDNTGFSSPKYLTTPK